MTDKEYHALNKINASFLKACAMGAHSGYKYLHMEPFQSDSMAFGSAVHSFVLEPHSFDKLYSVSEKFDCRTKAGKEGKAAFETINAGKLIIDTEDHHKLQIIDKRCRDIPAVREALQKFEIEKIIIWGDFKAKLDLVDMNNGIVIDLKTTKCADQYSFTKDFIKLNYSVQYLHYCKAVNATKCFVIAIESDSCEIALYNCTDIVFSDHSKNKYDRALATAREVMAMDRQPDKYPREIVNLIMPDWVKD
jgi:hypothetical protein